MVLFLIQGEQNFIASIKEKKVNHLSRQCYIIRTKDRSSIPTYIELLKFWLMETSFFYCANSKTQDLEPSREDRFYFITLLRQDI